jgi:predicted transposase YbfD/YdcC
VAYTAVTETTKENEKMKKETLYIITDGPGTMFGPFGEKWQAQDAVDRLVRSGCSLEIRRNRRDLKIHKVHQNTTRTFKVYYTCTKTGKYVFGWGFGE